MGMSTALHLKGNNYSNASAAFYIADLIAVLPNVLILNKVPASKWLAVCLVGWGITTACHAALTDYAGLLAVRVISGALESGIPPSLMLLSSQYFKRDEQATRFAFWYTGLGNGQIIGALISYGFQFVSPHHHFAGWRIMFILLGLLTIVLGIFVFFFVPNSPMEAKFLKPAERIALLEHVKVNQTGISGSRFHPGQLLEAALDPQIWIVFVLIILQSAGAGVITTYSATLLRTFGYTSKQSALLNIPSGVVNIITTLAYAFYVRYGGSRWSVTLAGSLLALIGACLLSFIPHSNKSGLLAGLYLVNVMPGISNITFQWLTCNTAGHTKRAFATAWMNAAFAIANIIGPETFKAHDAPLYKPAKLTLVIMWSVGVVLAMTLAAYYAFANKARDKIAQAARDEDDNAVDEKQGFSGLTDVQNKTFRYKW